MRILAITVVCLLVSWRPADADGTNVLIGPVLGLRLGGPAGSVGVFGIEGGVGNGPERLNLGFEHRADKMFGYIELDPWLVLGASLGVGVDSDGNPQPVLGLWEGVPLKLPGCEISPGRYDTAVSIAAGYRYTGVHELYVTVKAGKSQRFCFD